MLNGMAFSKTTWSQTSKQKTILMFDDDNVCVSHHSILVLCLPLKCNVAQPNSLTHQAVFPALSPMAAPHFSLKMIHTIAPFRLY